MGRHVCAERGSEKIAVEIQSFLSPSPVHDLQEAVGQYQVYRSVLGEIAPERQLYLAVPRRVHEGLLTERFGQLILQSLHLCLIVFNEQQERILMWIP